MKKMLATIALATLSVATTYAQNTPVPQGQGQRQGQTKGKKQ